MGDESTAYAHALRLLTLRARSSADLRQRLLKKGYSELEVDSAIARCTELDYINDPRSVKERAGALLRSGKVGQRLHYDLRREGFKPEDIQHAVATLSAEHSTQTVLAELFERRYATHNLDLKDKRQRRRVVNYLQRRGFTLTSIFDYIDERLNDSYADNK